MPIVRAVTSDGVFELSETGSIVVPAGDVVLSVEGAQDVDVRLDGRLRATQQVGATRVLAVDLTRSTGFHHLHVQPGHHFWFGSEDSKLRLAGIESMLAYLRTNGLNWSGQLFFSSGAAYRDPHVVYGWLDHHADDALSAARAIAARPHRRVEAVTAMTTRAGRRLAMRPTIALLRRRPAELVEQSETGVISIGAKRYDPLKVVAWHQGSSLRTEANMRAIWLTTQIAQLAREAAASLEGAEDQRRC